MTRKELYRRKYIAAKSEFRVRIRTLNAAEKAYHKTLQELKRARAKYEAVK